MSDPDLAALATAIFEARQNGGTTPPRTAAPTNDKPWLDAPLQPLSDLRAAMVVLREHEGLSDREALEVIAGADGAVPSGIRDQVEAVKARDLAKRDRAAYEKWLATPAGMKHEAEQARIARDEKAAQAQEARDWLSLVGEMPDAAEMSDDDAVSLYADALRIRQEAADANDYAKNLAAAEAGDRIREQRYGQGGRA